MSDKTREIVTEVAAGIGAICLILEAVTAAIFWLGPFSFGKTYVQIALGFLVGGIFAAVIFWHMGSSIDRTMEMEEKGAVNRSRMFSIIRTLAAFAAMAAVYLTGWVNLLSLLAGMMTLKVAAYLQPFTHKIMRKEEHT